MNRPVDDDEWMTHRLPLPFERPPKALSANSRVHYHARSTATRMVRQTVVVLAKAQGLHLIQAEHITARLSWAPGDRRRRDADNLFPLLKACCDALARGPRRDWIGLEIVPDDTPRYFTKLTPRIIPPPTRGMWLELGLELSTGE